MASFPNAVKSFTTKNIGDVIQPADVNDLQDEVNAIESGYINGTAPLNAANSTLANLSVPGGSTLTGNVNVGGNITVTGTISAPTLPVAFAVTGSTVTNSSAFTTVLAFEVPSSGWRDGERIDVTALTQIRMDGGSTASLNFRWSVGGNTVVIASAVNQLGTGAIHILNYQMFRNSTTVWIRNAASIVAADDYSFAYNNLAASAVPTASQINGVTFASSNTVALQVAWSAANSSNSYGVLGGRAIKA